MNLYDILNKATAKPHALSQEELMFLLEIRDEKEMQQLFHAAYGLKLRYTGKMVSIRGLIEMGNVCAKDCFYCGIRKSNPNVERFQLDREAVLRMSRWAWKHNFGSIVMQSGEMESEEHTAFVESLLRDITNMCNGELGITLSLGEQPEETLRRWKNAGAHRYLLRIESSSEEIYRAIHPKNHSFARRVECLKILRKLDYQVGSGVMIGLPGQSAAQLAGDIEFFRKMDLDMIGMGPFLPHHDTPMGKNVDFSENFRRQQLELGLKMISAVRLQLHNTNIASTTALEALRNDGRELGLLAGANVIMPNITDPEYRKNYKLYENKPAVNESSDDSIRELTRKVAAIGEEINWNKRGDSPHYFARH